MDLLYAGDLKNNNTETTIFIINFLIFSYLEHFFARLVEYLSKEVKACLESFAIFVLGRILALVFDFFVVCCFKW